MSKVSYTEVDTNENHAKFKKKFAGLREGSERKSVTKGLSLLQSGKSEHRAFHQFVMPNWHQRDEQKSQAFEEPDYAGYNNVSDDTQYPTGASVTNEQLHLFSD